jgi:hypothetical protein
MQNTMQPTMRQKLSVVSDYGGNPEVFRFQTSESATLPLSDTAAVDTSALAQPSPELAPLPTVPTDGSMSIPLRSVAVDPPLALVPELDTIVLTGAFTDSDLTRLDLYRVGWTLRSETGKEIKALSPLARDARLDRGDVTYSESEGGEVAVRYAWPVDTAVTPGVYDVQFTVERDRVMIILTIIIVIGVLSTLLYFYFSHEHKGALGAVARLGIWFIMISFGAHFGYTVMGRVSLLIGRVQFLIDDWIGTLL